MPLYPVTPPEGLLVSLEDAKSHLHVDGNASDGYITGLIGVATAHFDGRDGVLNRALRVQQWELRLDRFPNGRHNKTWRSHLCHGSIRIPLPPLISVETVKYYDVDGVQQTLDPSKYDVVGVGGMGKGYIAPLLGTSWPVAQHKREGISVKFTAGYPDTEDSPPKSTVPQPIRHAALLLIGHWFENREEVVIVNAQPIVMPKAADKLVFPYIVSPFADGCEDDY